jgi:hypothetical protein
MKKYLLLIVAATTVLFAAAQVPTVSKKEKKAAAKYLKETQKDLEKAVKGLSEAQMNFSPSADAWSVTDCVKHIAASEGGLRQMLDALLKAPANPEKRSEIKMDDAQWKAAVESRETKVKTMAPLEPKNTSFASEAAAMEAFLASRADLITLVKTTPVNLREHVGDLPFGKIDGYQMALFIGAHSRRHTAQINEVKANPAFPKQ